MSLLHVFDMDGTLLRGTTASIELARALDRLADLDELERGWASAALTSYDFAVGACDLYRDLTAALVADVFAGCSWMAGIAEVMADIRARGERSLVITMSPNFFADLLATMGVDEVRASRFPPLPLRLPPERSGILNPTDKVTIVDEVRTREGLRIDQCVAYGDSVSDVPLFGYLRHTVAINAGAELRRLAEVCGDGDNLWTIYQAARAELNLERHSGVMGGRATGSPT